MQALRTCKALAVRHAGVFAINLLKDAETIGDCGRTIEKYKE